MLAVALFISLFIFTSVKNIHAPGIHYDEVLFGNAALGGTDGSFILLAFKGFPILLMSYIGALKAYIFYPIFAIFGVSYETIRIPSILIMAFALVILHRALRMFTSTKVALITLALLSVDTSLIVLTRTDMGPTVLEFLLKALALYGYVYFIKTEKLKYGIIMLLAMYLGVFNKLNFIWTVNAFFLAAYIVHRDVWASAFRKLSRAGKIISLVGVFLIYAYFTMVTLHYHVFSNQYGPLSFMQHCMQQLTVLLKLLDGTAVYLWIFYEPLQTIFPTGLYMFLVMLCSVLTKSAAKISRKTIVFILLMFVLTAVQICLTPSATSPWHTMSVYPFIIILFALASDALAGAFFAQRKYVRILVTVALISPVLITSILTYSRYSHSYTQPISHPAWSNKIDVLIDYTHLQENSFVSIDWGIHNQLLIMNQKNTFFDHWEVLFKPMSKAQEQDYAREFLDPDKKVIFVAHSDTYSFFPESKNNFIALAQKYSLSVVKVKDIREGTDTFFELYMTQAHSE